VVVTRSGADLLGPADGLVLTGTDPGPRRKVAGGGELGHVVADLSGHGDRDPVADPEDGSEQVEGRLERFDGLGDVGGDLSDVGG
jgi:hypothetical protein